MIPAIRIALLSIKLVMRTKAALFFTFLFPLIFLFVYAGLFARGNPDAVSYMFGPVVTLNIMGSAFWGLGLQSVMQRERGSLRRYRLAPIGPGSMVLSSLLANYLLQLPTLVLLVSCATLIFHMPLRINPLSLLLLVTCGSFAFAGFGLTIASVANTMQEAQVYNNVVWFTLLFLSGVTVPLPLLPRWIQHFAAFLPATYLVNSFQAIMVSGDSLFDHRAEILALLISGTFGLLFAWKLFRWEKDEKISTRAKWIALTFIVPFLGTGVWMTKYGNLATTSKNTFTLVDHEPNAAAHRESPNTPMMLEDFENWGEEAQSIKTWRVVGDASTGGRSNGFLTLTSPGAINTRHALRFSGRIQLTGDHKPQDVAIQFPFRLPPSAASARGIELEVRGASRSYEIRLIPPSHSLPTPALTLIPDAEWQTVRLPAAWLTAPNPLPPQGILILEVEAEGPAGAFELDLDEIRFY